MVRIGVTEADLRDYTARPIYGSALWLAIKDNQTDEVVATGIAELDKEITIAGKQASFKLPNKPVPLA